MGTRKLTDEERNLMREVEFIAILKEERRWLEAKKSFSDQEKYYFNRHR